MLCVCNRWKTELVGGVPSRAGRTDEQVPEAGAGHGGTREATQGCSLRGREEVHHRQRRVSHSDLTPSHNWKQDAIGERKSYI